MTMKSDKSILQNAYCAMQCFHEFAITLRLLTLNVFQFLKLYFLHRTVRQTGNLCFR